MTDENTKFYLDFIAQEIDRLKEEPQFIGNKEFEISLEFGNIDKLKCISNKSIIREDKQYLKAIAEELKRLEEGKFDGVVSFRFNFSPRGLAYLNCSLNKTVKK